MRLVAFLGLVGVLLATHFTDEWQCAGLFGSMFVEAQLTVEDATTVRTLVLIVGVLVHLQKSKCSVRVCLAVELVTSQDTCTHCWGSHAPGTEQMFSQSMPCCRTCEQSGHLYSLLGFSCTWNTANVRSEYAML